MKKVITMLLTGVMVLGLLAGCGGENGQQTAGTPQSGAPAQTPAPASDSGQTWQLNLGNISIDPASVQEYNSIGRAIQYFADKTGEYTDGRVAVTCHWSSVLGSNVSMFEEVMMNSLDFHVGQPMSSADARFACWNLPFVFENYDEIRAATRRDGGPVFALSAGWMEERGVKLLAMGVGSMRGFVSSKPVYVPADARDLKIRTYEDALVNTFWGKIGTASIIPGSEIYSALQTKTVDAMEFHPVGVVSYKLYEVADYFTDLNWQWTCGAVLTCPMELWNSWPAEIQEAVQKAADEYAEMQYQWEVEDNKTVYGVIEDNGMTVLEPTDEQRQAWHDVADGLEDWFKEYVGADVYTAYMEAAEQAKASLG